MKKIFFLTLLLFTFIPIFTSKSLAQSPTVEINHPTQNYLKAEVIKIISTQTDGNSEFGVFKQILEARLLDGNSKGKIVKAENSASAKFTEQKKVNVADKIILLEVKQGKNITYSVWDKYRLNYIYFLVIGFFALIIIFAGLRGIGSIIGMISSFIILVGFIVPQILKGYDPLFITIIGSSVILFVTIFLAHGVSKKTTSALISTIISLTITGILAFVYVKMVNLTGLGDENSYMLQIGNVDINAQGLLLSGIIIGSLGVLDDVTTTQSASIFEFLKLNKKLSITDLYMRGYTVGREHITSLVNTLILAYAGASLGLFVIFVLNPNNMPIWVMLNDEMIIEEIVRAIIGSIGLILAVPVTTLVASYVAKKTIT